MLDDRITESRATTPHGRDLPGPIEAVAIDPESLARRHEVHDVNLRPILRFGLVLLIAAVVIYGLLWWMLRAWTNADLQVQPQVPPAAVTPQPMQGPGVQPFPASELDALRAAQMAHLEAYGWIDRAQEVVHIPVMHAMQLLVERGLPARPDAPAPTFGFDPAYELESEGGQARWPITATLDIEADMEAGTEDGQ